MEKLLELYPNTSSLVFLLSKTDNIKHQWNNIFFTVYWLKKNKTGLDKSEIYLMWGICCFYWRDEQSETVRMGC